MDFSQQRPILEQDIHNDYALIAAEFKQKIEKTQSIQKKKIKLDMALLNLLNIIKNGPDKLN